MLIFCNNKRLNFSQRKSLSELEKTLHGSIDDRLGKYDVKLDAYFTYQMESKKNQQLKELFNCIKNQKTDVVDKFANWPFSAPYENLGFGDLGGKISEFSDCLNDLHFGYLSEVVDHTALKNVLAPSGVELKEAPNPPHFQKVDYQPVSIQYQSWYCKIGRLEKLVSNELTISSRRLNNYRMIVYGEN